MTRQEIIDHCLTLPETYLDYPFDGGATALRHRGNKRIFALFLRTKGEEVLNLKCEPVMAELLRQQYTGVLPGYYMSKKHWNSIVLNGDVPDAELRWQIERSYDLIRPKERRRKTT